MIAKNNNMKPSTGLYLVTGDLIDEKIDSIIIPYIGDGIKYEWEYIRLENARYSMVVYLNLIGNPDEISREFLYLIADAYQQLHIRSAVLPYSYFKSLNIATDELYNEISNIMFNREMQMNLYINLDGCFSTNQKAFYNEIVRTEKYISVSKVAYPTLSEYETDLSRHELKEFKTNNKIIEYELIRYNKEERINSLSKTLNNAKTINKIESMDNSKNFVDSQAKSISDPKEALRLKLLAMLENIRNNPKDKKLLQQALLFINNIFRLISINDSFMNKGGSNVGLFLDLEIENKNILSNMINICVPELNIDINRTVDLNEEISDRQLSNYRNKYDNIKKITLYRVALFLEFNLSELLQLMSLGGYSFSANDTVDKMVSEYYLSKRKFSYGDFCNYLIDKSKGNDWLMAGKEVIKRFYLK